jgi:tRNA(Ile)-lysidine synthase
VTRTDIESWLKSIGQDFITDSTNLVDDVMRNRIRLNILPMLRQMVPSVSENLHTTAQLLTEACRIYDNYTDSIIRRVVIDNRLDINELKKTSSLISILFEWLSKFGFPSATIRQISEHLDAPNGRYWSSGTHDVCIDRGYLILLERKPKMSPLRIPEIGLYNVSSNLQIRVSTTTEVRVDRRPQVACLDAALVKFPLIVRPVSKGDRFVPYGMNGSKLLSDFFTDLKLSIFDKRNQLVVTDADGRIIWVVGQRISQLCAITPMTQTMLQMTVIVD